MFIEYHADDFGVFVSQSKRILECFDEGALNGISVIPNGFELEECMAMLTPEMLGGDLRIAVHLNVAPGWKALSGKSDIALLTDEKGVFDFSFGKYLLYSYAPKSKREEYKKALGRELELQIAEVLKYLPDGYKLRIDGHQHFHMLPIVFDALVDIFDKGVIKVESQEYAIDLEYIRSPSERKEVINAAKTAGLKIKLINRIKVSVLNYLIGRNKRVHPKYSDILDSACFTGVLFSGNMNEKTAKSILPAIKKLAEMQDIDAEVLFHPGGLDGLGDRADVSKMKSDSDISFFLSKGREEEYAALKSL